MSDKNLRKRLVTLAKIHRIPGYPYKNIDNETLEYKLYYGSEGAKADNYTLKHRNIASEPFRKQKKHPSYPLRAKSYSRKRKSPSRRTRKSPSSRKKSPSSRKKSPSSRKKSPSIRKKSMPRRKKSPSKSRRSRTKSPSKSRRSRTKSPRKLSPSLMQKLLFMPMEEKELDRQPTSYNSPFYRMPTEFDIKKLQDNHDKKMRDMYSSEELDNLEQEGIMPGFLAPTLLPRYEPSYSNNNQDDFNRYNQAQNQRILSRVSKL
jgi:hypothetical protein